MKIEGPDENGIVTVEIPPYIFRFLCRKDQKPELVSWATSLEKPVPPSTKMVENARDLARIRFCLPQDKSRTTPSKSSFRNEGQLPLSF